MAGLIDHRNYVSRNFNGQPVRPEQATPEMIQVAERVIEIMVKNGHAHGYFGDKGNAFATDQVTTDQVNRLLRDFVQFAQTQTKADYAKVNCNVEVLGSEGISAALIEQYARLSGYAVSYHNRAIVGVDQ